MVPVSSGSSRNILPRKIVPAVPKWEDIVRINERNPTRVTTRPAAPIEKDTLEQGARCSVNLPPQPTPKYIPPAKRRLMQSQALALRHRMATDPVAIDAGLGDGPEKGLFPKKNVTSPLLTKIGHSGLVKLPRVTR